jgi:hypothetical protein
MDMIAKQAKRYHGTVWSEHAQGGQRTVTEQFSSYTLKQERKLAYDMTLHQHPYVQALVQRLLRQGSQGLLAADTEYNTLVKLKAAVAATGTDGRAVQLASGEAVYLDDGATATFTGGTVVRFGGPKVLKATDATVVVPAANQELTIARDTELRRGNGKVVRLGAPALAAMADSGPRPRLFAEIFSPSVYNPGALVRAPYPLKELDFSTGGAYSGYNWELFFHVPLTMALHLSKNGRHPEAQRWFHLLFDPTDDSEGPTPERFWKVRPFQTTVTRKVEDLLVNLVTGADEKLREETVASLAAWRDAPFRPHVIARFRQQAYMMKTVMAYLDNLIAWGDSLFRQDTGEAIDEAMMVYVLAANILGPRPEVVPRKGKVRPQTYENLKDDLREFGTVLRDVEPDLPFDLLPAAGEPTTDSARQATLRSMGQALYFSVPRNDKLVAYWDTVADRLFKIRNSLNLQGVFRRLALFEPPIDPAMLARAAAAGLDIGAVVNGIHQPLPLVRFALLAQKAGEIAQEVKALGGSLLAAMEKEDAEAMALLRSRHERALLLMVEQVKYAQWQEAIKAREGLLRGLALSVQRYRYYERLLGKADDQIKVPELDDLDRSALSAMKLKVDEPVVAPHDDNLLKALINAQLPSAPMNMWEAGEIMLLTGGHVAQSIAAGLDMMAAVAALVPEFQVRATPWGIGGGVTYGGKAISTASTFGAKSASAVAADLNFLAGMTAKVGGYVRRAQEWEHQSNLAAGEISQVFKQLRAAQIREAIAEQELRSHRQQMKNADEIERFLNEDGAEKSGKKSNRALYAWMKREVRGLYAQCFQLAFDVARKAERALQHELGRPELSYLQFGYLAGKEGLLAGERLFLDIKRMELAYHEQNQREYELTRHVSLLQLSPLELVRLRSTGRCSVKLPESLFDMDGPGHYFRRIRGVSVSIPCVTGPYASVACTLRLLRSSIRKTAVVGDSYPRVDANDERFSDHFGSVQAIVTSSGQNDTGLFDGGRDERYQPFEYAGAVSEWELQLSADPSAGDPASFDYATISDVLLHLRYTAREGGNLLRRGAMDAVKAEMTAARALGSVRLFSLRQEFPGEWARFRAQPASAQARAELAITLRPEHFPYWSQGRLGPVQRVDVLVRSGKAAPPQTLQVFAAADDASSTRKDQLAADPGFGGLLLGRYTGGASGLQLPGRPDGDWKLCFADNDLADVLVAVSWQRTA